MLSQDSAGSQQGLGKISNTPPQQQRSNKGLDNLISTSNCTIYFPTELQYCFLRHLQFQCHFSCCLFLFYSTPFHTNVLVMPFKLGYPYKIL